MTFAQMLTLLLLSRLTIFCWIVTYYRVVAFSLQRLRRAYYSRTSCRQHTYNIVFKIRKFTNYLKCHSFLYWSDYFVAWLQRDGRLLYLYSGSSCRRRVCTHCPR
jgi:hypothetical protein